MIPINIQVSRSKAKVKPISHVGKGEGALVFYKHLFFYDCFINPFENSEKILLSDLHFRFCSILLIVACRNHGHDMKKNVLISGTTCILFDMMFLKMYTICWDNLVTWINVFTASPDLFAVRVLLFCL